MKSFVVLIVVENLNTNELEIALRSFAHLVAKVTPKHRKALRLQIVDDGQQNLLLQCLLQRFELINYAIVQSQWKPSLTERNVLFAPTLQLDIDTLQQSLHAGVPIITYESNRSKQHIDKSCGVLRPYRSGERAVQEFSTYLNMLYFDPEAQQCLQKGALRRSQRQPIQLPTASLSMAS